MAISIGYYWILALTLKAVVITTRVSKGCTVSTTILWLFLDFSSRCLQLENQAVRLLRVHCDSSNVVTRTCHFDITFLEKCQNCKTGPRFDNDITGIAVHSQQSYCLPLTNNAISDLPDSLIKTAQKLVENYKIPFFFWYNFISLSR